MRIYSVSVEMQKIAHFSMQNVLGSFQKVCQSPCLLTIMNRKHG